ncbi:hypothetical protein NHJ13051_005270 [Beauveria bassiana]
MGSVETLESFDSTNFDPIPLPNHLSTYELPRVSISKLMNSDDVHTKTVFDICSQTGFFYLDLMDLPLGRRLWENACKVRNIVQHLLATLPEEVKRGYRTRVETGVLDRGYTMTTPQGQGVAKYVESLNIPRDELFAKTTPGWELPTWLKQHQDLFKEIQVDAHAVEQTLLAALEKHLGLATGSLTKTHQLEIPSYSFLRVLRHPPSDPATAIRDRPRIFAHRDVVSISMLFTWLGGLQIPKDDAANPTDDTAANDDSWLWVPPEAGHMIVNLGDAMPIFTNGVLKSGLHRVVTAPGEQAKFDRMSVLLTGRPNWEVPMEPLKGTNIPTLNLEQAENKTVVSCKEWGDNVIRGYYQNDVKWKDGSR